MYMYPHFFQKCRLIDQQWKNKEDLDLAEQLYLCTTHNSELVFHTLDELYPLTVLRIAMKISPYLLTVLTGQV